MLFCFQNLFMFLGPIAVVSGATHGIMFTPPTQNSQQQGPQAPNQQVIFFTANLFFLLGY